MHRARYTRYSNGCVDAAAGPERAAWRLIQVFFRYPQQSPGSCVACSSRIMGDRHSHGGGGCGSPHLAVAVRASISCSNERFGPTTRNGESGGVGNLSAERFVTLSKFRDYTKLYSNSDAHLRSERVSRRQIITLVKKERWYAKPTPQDAPNDQHQSVRCRAVQTPGRLSRSS